MFTVKYVRSDGVEEIETAHRVVFCPDQKWRMFPDAPNPHLNGVISLIAADGTSLNKDIHGGIVYVMNEAGKTVSKYDLGEDDGRRGAA